MKLVSAVIKPYKLDDVRQALAQTGVNGITLSEVRGFGRQKGHTELYRGTEYAVEFVPKIRLEVAIRDESLDAVTEAILASAGSGRIGDGKLFITELEQVVRIRTGETGETAL